MTEAAIVGGATTDYTYDANGNCTEIDDGTVTRTLTYDFENRVTGIAYSGGPLNATSNTFTYNGFNLRQSKSDSVDTFNYVTDGTTPAAPVLKDGRAVYTPGISESRTVGMSSVSKFYHTDGLGSVRGITEDDQDTSDTVLYDAFGNTVNRTGSTPTPFQFAGAWQYQTDDDSDLQLLGHRYYDPSIGRFLSKDPIKSGDNWYAYCENNPLAWIDADGLELSLPWPVGGLAGAVGRLAGLSPIGRVIVGGGAAIIAIGSTIYDVVQRTDWSADVPRGPSRPMPYTPGIYEPPVYRSDDDVALQNQQEKEHGRGKRRDTPLREKWDQQVEDAKYEDGNPRIKGKKPKQEHKQWQVNHKPSDPRVR